MATGKAGGSENFGRNFFLSAIEMFDQRKSRMGKDMQEFHPEVEVRTSSVHLRPYDLAVHPEGLIGFFDVADGEIYLAANPGPGNGNIRGIGINPAVGGSIENFAIILYTNVVQFRKPFALPPIHLSSLRAIRISSHEIRNRSIILSDYARGEISSPDFTLRGEIVPFLHNAYPFRISESR